MRRKVCALASLLLAWCLLSAHSCCGGALLKVFLSLPSVGSGGGAGSSPPRLLDDEERFRDIAVVLEKVDRYGYHTLSAEERELLIRYRMRR